MAKYKKKFFDGGNPLIGIIRYERTGSPCAKRKV
jgi:hypothetical protein